MTVPSPHHETLIARISMDRAAAHVLADALAEQLDPETCAVSMFEDGDRWTVEAAFHDEVCRALISQTVAHVSGADASHEIAFSTVGTRDWVAASLEGLAPVQAGRFIVHGAHDRARVRPNQIGIEIEAALAFGTGHHGTTRGCLIAFESLRKAVHAGRRWRILDVGTGTGLLAIAAAKAMRVPVLASDIDPVAVSVARDNARLNRVIPLFQALAAGGVGSGRIRHGRYDLIFANILEAPLRRMSAPLSRLLARGGRLVLSGLLCAHAPGVTAAYLRQGLQLQSRTVLDGWVTLVMRRGANAKRPGDPGRSE